MDQQRQICMSCFTYLTAEEKAQLKTTKERSADYVIRALAIRLSHRAQSRRGINP